MTIVSVELFQESIEHPYIASEERNMAILANMNKLEKGIAKDQVIDYL